MRTSHLILCALCALLLSACSNNSSETNQDNAPAQALMRDWRAANDILKGMTENPANFNAARLQEQAQFFADSSPTMWSHFDKSLGTDANKVGFEAKAAEFDSAVAALLEASKNADDITDVDAAIGALGESCGSCHKLYKK